MSSFRDLLGRYVSGSAQAADLRALYAEHRYHFLHRVRPLDEACLPGGDKSPKALEILSRVAFRCFCSEPLHTDLTPFALAYRDFAGREVRWLYSWRGSITSRFLAEERRLGAGSRAAVTDTQELFVALGPSTSEEFQVGTAEPAAPGPRGLEDLAIRVQRFWEEVLTDDERRVLVLRGHGRPQGGLAGFREVASEMGGRSPTACRRMEATVIALIRDHFTGDSPEAVQDALASWIWKSSPSSRGLPNRRLQLVRTPPTC